MEGDGREDVQLIAMTHHYAQLRTGFAVLVTFMVLASSVSPAHENAANNRRGEVPNPVCIVAFGDSTTAVWSKEIEKAYSQRLTEALALQSIKAEVINSGISGETTADGRARFDRDVRRHRPDLVIIQFGINDSWIDADLGKTEPRLTREQYRRNLRYMIETLKGDGAKVILATPNPMRWSDEYKKMFSVGKPLLDVNDIRGINRLLDLYADDVRRIAREENVRLVDVHKRFEDYGTVRKQNVSDLLLSDGIHPNDKGHALIAGLLMEQILFLLGVENKR